MKSLTKQFEAVTFSWNSATWDITTLDGSVIEIVNAANTPKCVLQGGYFDLAGLTREEKTLFIQGLEIQLQAPPDCIDGESGDALQYTLILKDTPIKPLDYAGPGFAGIPSSAENCILNKRETYAVTTDAASWSTWMTPVNSSSNGTCVATASDRIYYGLSITPLTRKIGATTSGVTLFTMPGLRIRMLVDLTKEAEYQYIMRLRRSYELAQTPPIE